MCLLLFFFFHSLPARSPIKHFKQQIKRLLILAITGERVVQVRERNKLRALEPTDVHINRREGREYRKLTRREWRWDVAIIPYLHSCRAERTKSAPERTHVQLFRLVKVFEKRWRRRRRKFRFYRRRWVPADGEETLSCYFGYVENKVRGRATRPPSACGRREKKKKKENSKYGRRANSYRERERESGIKWKLSLSLLVYTIPNRHFLHLLQDPYLNMQTRNTE